MFTNPFHILRSFTSSIDRKSRHTNARCRVRKPTIEGLEGRRLLAGDVVAEIRGDTLEITGDSRGNSLRIESVRELQSAGQLVKDGVTSVFLDLPLLESVGLNFFGTSDDTVPPADGDFQVGFSITDNTDFVYTIEDGFAPKSGQILHAGTVLFNEGALEIGNFAIGFDPSRALGEASGFFVADTFAGLGPVFDIGQIAGVDAGTRDLTIAGAELLVSPELAGILGDAALAGVDVGGAQIDAIAQQLRLSQVKRGATSVELDLPLLEEAAGLSVSSLNGTARPAADNFQVAFKITQSTDFNYTIANGFAPEAGQIEHRGTVGFNADEIIVGDFSIGFDPERADGNATGFFVQSTTGLTGTLFDIGGSVEIDASLRRLNIREADLLVAPEFADILGNSALTGADVGNAQINARSSLFFQSYVVVRGRSGTDVNGDNFATFSSDEFTNIDIELNGGSDVLTMNRVELKGNLAIDMGNGHRDQVFLNGLSVGGALSVDTGDGRDSVNVNFVRASSLDIETGAGRDSVTLIRAHTHGDASVNLGSGSDRLRVLFSKIGGTADFDGGSGFDRFDSFFSSYGVLNEDDFEFGWIF